MLLSGLLLAGCGSSEPSVQDLMPPPAGQGMQFAMTSQLMPGQEIERCKFLVAPPEGLNINHDEVRYTAGSHHVLLYLTPYDKIPTTDVRGAARDTSGVFDCANGAGADWRITQVLAGAQSRNGGRMIDFPADTAIKVPGGAVLLMNTHYLNASLESLDAEVRINVYTLPDAQVQREGGLMFFYNPFISIPGESKASARMRCPVNKDITLVNVQSHMHRRGVDYVAQLLGADEKPVEMLYQNSNWEDVPVQKWEPGKPLAAGQMLDYRCDYDNPEARTVSQGQSTRDEMCMMIGSYYPRDRSFELCEHGTFVGTGSKSCGLALTCALAAAGSGDNASFYGCVVDSCESNAHQVTDALTCYFQRGGAACEADCKSGSDPVKCQGCVMTACQPALDACQKARCN